MVTDHLDLAALLTDPARAAEVPVAEVYELLGRLDVVKHALLARVAIPASAPAAPAPERLLDVEEVASRSGMSASWLYRNHHRLPFTRRIGRAVRFSEPGFERWMASRGRPLQQASSVR